MSAVAVTGTTAYVSNAIDAGLIASASVQIVSTSTATGTAKLQMSNDQYPAGNIAGFVPTNWTDIASSTASVAGAGAALIPRVDCAYRWLRIVYTNATNTGTVSAQFNGIGF